MPPPPSPQIRRRDLCTSRRPQCQHPECAALGTASGSSFIDVFASPSWNALCIDAPTGLYGYVLCVPTW